MYFFDPGIVFVIGPSGIGKSTATKRLRRIEGGKLYDVTALDDVVAERARALGMTNASAFDVLRKIGTNGFFLCGVALLFHRLGREPRKRITVVDVGAAFQDIPTAQTFCRLSPTICITAPPSEAYLRYCAVRGQSARPFENFVQHEFSAARKKVYESATATLETEKMDIDAMAAALHELVSSLLVEHRTASESQSDGAVPNAQV